MIDKDIKAAASAGHPAAFSRGPLRLSEDN
jgi:hypothetical protein